MTAATDINVNVSAILEHLGACDEAQEWAESYTDARAAWEQCERADWMFWLARELNIDHKKRVRAACACARTALKYLPEGEDRPLVAIETTERWCDGAATLAEVIEARRGAYAAYDAAYAAAAAADADAAAYAAAYAATADAAAYAAAARKNALKEMAVLVRQHITFDDIVAAIAERF